MKRLRLVAVIAGALLFAGAARASEFCSLCMAHDHVLSDVDLVSNRTVSVAVRMGENGRDTFGFSEFGWRIVRQMAIPRHNNIVPCRGAFSMRVEDLCRAGADILPAVFWTPALTNSYTPISQPVARATIELSAPKGSRSRFVGSSPAHWPEIRVAYVDGVLDPREDFTRWTKRNDVKATLFAYDDISQAMESVRKGECDLLLAVVGHTPEGFECVADVQMREVYFAVRKDRDDLHAAFSHDLLNFKLRERDWWERTWQEVFGKPIGERVVRAAVYFEPGLFEYGPCGGISGAAADYMRRIADMNGWTYDIVLCPYEDALRALREGLVDLVGGVTFTPIRGHQFYFSRFAAGAYQDFIYSKTLPVVSSETAYKWQRSRIIVGPGDEARARLEAYLARFQIKAELVPHPSALSAIRAYEAGEGDALFTVAYANANAREVVVTFPSVPWYFCAPKEDKALQADLDGAIMRVQSQLSGGVTRANASHSVLSSRAELSLTEEESQYLAERIAMDRPVYVETSPDALLWKEWDELRGSLSGVLKQYLQTLSMRTGLRFEPVQPTTQAAARLRYLNGEVDLWAAYMADVDDLPADCRRFVVSSRTTVVAIHRGFVNPRPGVTRFAVRSCDSERRDFLTRRGYGGELVLCDTEEECFEAVDSRMADATLSTSRSALVIMRRLDLLDDIEIRSVPELARMEDVAFLFSPKADPTLASIVEKAMHDISPLDVEQMLRESVYAQIGRIRFTAVQVVTLVSSGVALLLVIIVVVAVMLVVRARRAADVAKAAGAAKAQFLSTISHEIRTPLNVLAGFADFLNQPNLSPEQVKEYTDGIRLSSRVLLSLINDVLDLSKLDAGKMNLAGQCVLSDLFSVLKVMFESAARKKGLDFEIIAQPGLPVVGISAQRLRQILFNVISNAVKYTEKGKVRVEAFGVRGADPEHVNLTLRVTDTGIGISEEKMKAVFDPFVQDITWRGGKVFEGTGLGLAIVKRLVDAAGGTVSLESRGGVGTTVTVFLPALRVVAKSELEVGVGKGETANELAAKRLPFDATTKVLVVDDIALNVRIFSIYLKKLGVKEILVANSGGRALELVRSQSPSFVFTDMWMPEMNGAELAAEIRDLPGGMTMKIIAVTADADSAASFNLEKFDAVMTKPVTEEKIVRVIRNLRAAEVDPAPAAVGGGV